MGHGQGMALLVHPKVHRSSNDKPGPRLNDKAYPPPNLRAPIGGQKAPYNLIVDCRKKKKKKGKKNMFTLSQIN